MKRYEKINLVPPKSVQNAAKRGLFLRKKFRRGGLPSRIAGKLGIGSGIVRAVNLSKENKLNPRTVKRMHNYFSRHAKDRKPDWGNPHNPTNGYIAWMLWGGDAGKKWADKIVMQIRKEDENKKS